MKRYALTIALVIIFVIMYVTASADSVNLSTKAMKALEHLLCSDDTIPLSCTSPGEMTLTGDLTVTGSFSPGTFGLPDTDASNLLMIKWNENDTANRTLNLLVSGGTRSFTLSGDAALNQNLLTTSTPAFASATFGINGVGGTSATLTLRDGANPGTTETLTYAKWNSLNDSNGLVAGNGSGTFSAITTSAGVAGIIGDETGSNYMVFSTAPVFDTNIQIGKAGQTGSLKLYSEQGATDYIATLLPNAAMTSNASFYLPADEPVAESWLTMGVDGIIDYTAISGETLATVTARGATTTDSITVGPIFTSKFDSLAYWTATQADGAGVTFDSVSDGTPGFTFSDNVGVTGKITQSTTAITDTNSFAITKSLGLTTVAYNLATFTSTIDSGGAPPGETHLSGSIVKIVDNNSVLKFGDTNAMLALEVVSGASPAWTYASKGDVGIENDLEVGGIIYVTGGGLYDDYGFISSGTPSYYGELDLNGGGIAKFFDVGNDTNVQLGPVGDGTTILGVTGTINATGLQVGGAPVLTAEADTLATVTARGATTTDSITVGPIFTSKFDAAAYWTATQADTAGVTFDSVSDGAAIFDFSDTIRLPNRVWYASYAVDGITSVSLLQIENHNKILLGDGTYDIEVASKIGSVLSGLGDKYSFYATTTSGDASATGGYFTANGTTIGYGVYSQAAGALTNYSFYGAGGSMFSAEQLTIAGAATVDPTTANYTSYGNNGVVVEGSGVDTKEWSMVFPANPSDDCGVTFSNDGSMELIGSELNVGNATNYADFYIHNAGGFGIYDAGDDTLVYFGSVVDGTTTLPMEGTFGFQNNVYLQGRNALNSAYIDMIKINASDRVEFGADVEIGSFEFAEDSGPVTMFDMAVSATPAVGAEESVAFKIDAITLMKVYAEADSSGGIQNPAIHIGYDDYFVHTYLHDASTIVFYDDADDTSATLGPTFNGLSALGLTGSLMMNGAYVDPPTASYTSYGATGIAIEGSTLNNTEQTIAFPADPSGTVSTGTGGAGAGTVFTPTTSPTWVVNALTGYTLVDGTSATFTIASNTATAITVVSGAPATSVNPWSVTGGDPITTIANAGTYTVAGYSGNASTNFLTLSDLTEATSGNTSATNSISFMMRGYHGDGPGVESHEAARIRVNKSADWYHATTEDDYDSTVTISGVKEGAEIDYFTLQYVSTVPQLSILGYVSAFYLSASQVIYGPYIRLTGSASTDDVANVVNIGNDKIIVEGTNDTNELAISWPTYTDTLDGDITRNFVVSSTKPTAGAGVDEYTPSGQEVRKYRVTFADLAAAATTKDVTIATLPIKCILMSAYLVVATQGVFGDTVTLSLGSAGATYDQIIADCDGKAAGNTVYGDADLERGTDLPDADVMGTKLYSYTATQALTLHADGNGTNLNDAGFTAGVWDIYITYQTLP